MSTLTIVSVIITLLVVAFTWVAVYDIQNRSD